jgi:hypothetical protein
MSISHQTVVVGELPVSESVTNNATNYNLSQQNNNLSQPSLLESQTVATFKKNVICYDVIKDFSIKNKRRVFSDMRTASIPVSTNTFFPRYGFTSGEFSTWTILTESNRKTTRSGVKA